MPVAPARVVVVVLENHGCGQVLGRREAPFLRLIEDLYRLPRIGASATAAPITGVIRR